MTAAEERVMSTGFAAARITTYRTSLCSARLAGGISDMPRYEAPDPAG